MSAGLIFCNVQPPTMADRRRASSRDILVASIDLQIRIAEAFKIGQGLTTTRLKIHRINSEQSVRKKQVDVRHRRWFWIDCGDGKIYYQVRYGNRIIDLSREGRLTICAGTSIDNLIESYGELKKYVSEGAYDDLIQSTRNALAKQHGCPRCFHSNG